MSPGLARHAGSPGVAGFVYSAKLDALGSSFQHGKQYACLTLPRHHYHSTMMMLQRCLMRKLSQLNMLLFCKARLLRSLARLHSRASFTKAKQGGLFIKLCGAGLARGAYDIMSLKFSHEVCYAAPWIFIGQILFLNVVDGHYCKPVDGNHATDDQCGTQP